MVIFKCEICKKTTPGILKTTGAKIPPGWLVLVDDSPTIKDENTKRYCLCSDDCFIIAGNIVNMRDELLETDDAALTFVQNWKKITKGKYNGAKILLGG